MSRRKRIAFYTTMKAPDHLVPSGDRQLARMLKRALEKADFQLVDTPAFSTYCAKANEQKLARMKEEAYSLIESLSAQWKNPDQRPDLWFTYHLYYKSPDLLGPILADRFNMPYVVAEASYAGKRNSDQWADWQALIEPALQRATMILCLSEQDRLGLASLVDETRLIDFPPMTDTPVHLSKTSVPGKQLLTCAMMRPGQKLQNYQFLCQALKHAPQDWSLTIVGDGPARAEIEQIFNPFRSAHRINFTGVLPQSEIWRLMAQSDLFLWPGLDEPLGLVYLEAQANGLPVVAINSGGVAAMLKPPQTGLLLPAADPLSYGITIGALLSDPARLIEMRQNACVFIASERTLNHASQRLKALLGTL